jgi:late competence protein required for DNA uptake (superfamily II DNA/RNA helicase)
MFKCERCGSGYSANHIGVENCPRCLLRDRVESPLSFKMFKIGQAASEGASPPISGGEPAQQVRSAR